MTKTIAFVSQSGNNEQTLWLKNLQTEMPEYDIIPFQKLTDIQKNTINVAIVANPDPKNLAQLPALVWVHSLWAGVDRILNEMPEAPFKIIRLIDPRLSDVMAEAVLAWSLYLHRQMPLYAQQQQAKLWRAEPIPMAAGRHIAILGLGQLGRRAAEVLHKNTFDVSGWSASYKDLPDITCYHGDAGLKRILGVADYIILLLPYTPQTKHLINAETLGYMKKGACIINFARGGIINDHDLLSALNKNHINHAVLDAFTSEPLPPSHPYWHHPNVTVLPHISAPSDYSSASRIVGKNLNTYFETGIIPNSVDKHKGY